MAFSATTPSIANADVNVVHDAITAITLKRAVSWPMFVDRSSEGRLARARSAILHLPSLGATAATSRGRTDAYDNRSELGATQIVHEIDKHFESGFKLSYIDALEVPWDTVAQGRQSMDLDMMIKVEDELSEYILALTTKALTTRTLDFAVGDTTNAAGSGDNGNAGKVGEFKYGASGHIITAAGVATATSRAYPAKFLRDVAVRWKRRNVRGGASIGGDPMTMAAVAYFTPEIFDVLVDWLIAEDFHFDSLTSPLLSGPSILTTMDFEGMLWKFHIVSTNAIPAPTSSGTTRPWRAVAMTPKAVKLSKRPTFNATFGATDNETEPFYQTNMICDWGHDLFNRELLVRGRFETAV